MADRFAGSPRTSHCNGVPVRRKPSTSSSSWSAPGSGERDDTPASRSSPTACRTSARLCCASRSASASVRAASSGSSRSASLALVTCRSDTVRACPMTSWSSRAIRARSWVAARSARPAWASRSWSRRSRCWRAIRHTTAVKTVPAIQAPHPGSSLSQSHCTTNPATTPAHTTSAGRTPPRSAHQPASTHIANQPRFEPEPEPTTATPIPEAIAPGRTCQPEAGPDAATATTATTAATEATARDCLLETTPTATSAAMATGAAQRDALSNMCRSLAVGRRASGRTDDAPATTIRAPSDGLQERMRPPQ